VLSSPEQLSLERRTITAAIDFTRSDFHLWMHRRQTDHRRPLVRPGHTALNGAIGLVGAFMSGSVGSWQFDLNAMRDYWHKISRMTGGSIGWWRRDRSVLDAATSRATCWRDSLQFRSGQSILATVSVRWLQWLRTWNWQCKVHWKTVKPYITMPVRIIRRCDIGMKHNVIVNERLRWQYLSSYTDIRSENEVYYF